MAIGAAPAPTASINASDASDASSTVRVDFDDLTPTLALTTGRQSRTALSVTGDTRLRAQLVTLDRAAVGSVVDGIGGRAAQLPKLGADRAVITVTASDATRSLTPGASNFIFSARFKLDARSEGLSSDNGNNLVQRGLWADPGQFKLQVDRRKVSCRIAGRAGVAHVESPVVVAPDAWHRAKCLRDRNIVRLFVTRPDGTVVRTSTYAPTGEVMMATRTPLAVGGKVSSSGIPVRGDSDQFNGIIDDVVVAIPRSG